MSLLLYPKRAELVSLPCFLMNRCGISFFVLFHGAHNSNPLFQKFLSCLDTREPVIHYKIPVGAMA